MDFSFDLADTASFHSVLDVGGPVQVLITISLSGEESTYSSRCQ